MKRGGVQGEEGCEEVRSVRGGGVLGKEGEWVSRGLSMGCQAIGRAVCVEHHDG